MWLRYFECGVGTLGYDLGYLGFRMQGLECVDKWLRHLRALICLSFPAVFICICMLICICIYMMCTCIHFPPECIFICMYIHVYMYIYVCIYVYDIYMYTLSNFVYIHIVYI